jgi:hypothetical protein
MDISQTTHKIARAVEPMKAVAQRDAVDKISKKIERTIDELAEMNWDRGAYAPYPSSKLPRVKFLPLLDKYNFVRRITEGLVPSRSHREPDYCKVKPMGIELVLQATKKDAGFLFEAFVCKLAKKVGAGVLDISAEATDGGLWYNSSLFVRVSEDVTETWKTTMIINCSVYGKLFLQWPTRKAK